MRGQSRIKVFSPILTFKGLKEILHVNTVLDPQQNLGRKIKRGNVGDALPGWKTENDCAGYQQQKSRDL